MDAAFLILCYNQENYIAQSILSALEQKDVQLNIIISDDCSTDRTFDIVRDIVSSYKGPHFVHIYRNEKNLGLSGNFNRSMGYILDDIVILGAGDDIFHPYRASMQCELMRRKSCYLICSEVDFIVSNSGRFRTPFLRPYFHTSHVKLQGALDRMGLYIGATGAFRRELFTKYGPVRDNCYEDLVLGVRALLEGDIVFCNHSLVSYRLGVGISTQRKSTSFHHWFLERKRVSFIEYCVSVQRLDDLRKNSLLSNFEYYERLASSLVVRRRAVANIYGNHIFDDEKPFEFRVYWIGVREYIKIFQKYIYFILYLIFKGLFNLR